MDGLAVELDDEIRAGPVGVYLVAGNQGVCLGKGEVVASAEGEEGSLEVGAGGLHLVADVGESSGQCPSAVLPVRSMKEVIDRVAVEGARQDGLLEGAVQLWSGEDGGEVEEGARDRGGGQAFVVFDVIGVAEGVDPDGAGAAASAKRGRELDAATRGPDEVPLRGRGSVAERGAGHGEEGGVQAASVGQRRMANRVDPMMHAVQLARVGAVLDRPPAETELEELRVGHDATLPLGQLREGWMH